MERLLAALGNPEKKLRCLHVAGTNGKGSVCAFAESLLRQEGCRTGLYTSPHLVHFSERIRIDGMPASDTELELGIGRLREASLGWSEEELPSFFELVTALAFDLFARAGCEVVVLETGLGGRLDATNTAPKIACAITPIALDHQEWLGESLTAIAREKGGVFRPGVPVVIAPQEEVVREALFLMAREVGVSWIAVTEPLKEECKLGLRGSHQRENAALALALIRAGGFHPSEEVIERGLGEVFWPGRFQLLQEGMLILDGAHNLHAAHQLVETWKEEFGDQKCRLIFGALEDKDPENLLRVLESIAEEVFLVPVASPRSLHPSLLFGTLSLPSQIFGSLKEALEKAFPERNPLGELAGENRRSPVLLAGSLFLVGEALALELGWRVFPRSQ
jgi:dihydrofolate synthase/folylpolyglutamate synthase